MTIELKRIRLQIVNFVLNVELFLKSMKISHCGLESHLNEFSQPHKLHQRGETF